MSIDPVAGCPDIYALDTEMLGMRRVNSPYILDGPEPAIIDTGTAEADRDILAGLSELGIDAVDVAYIVPTHAHLDHAGSAGSLASACPNATVLCHERGVEYLTDEDRLERLTESVERAIGMESPYGEPEVIDPDRCESLGGGEVVECGERALDVIDAPGHAPHQFCLYDRDTGALFGADAAGMNFPDVGHRPTTPPPNFDLEAALGTIDRLLEHEPETLLYAHYGPGERGAAVEELRRYREMLPDYVERIDSLRAEHGDDVGAIAAAMEDEWGHWSLPTDVAGVLRHLSE
ncbi:MBL fold metallo-hydrolase [Halovenus sp. WSH3]|uniref:MBL fold metallo-hydrolase n=1 Tax=Halovenus carboxidivorans TaxID=2692199 RepID=A0A6B0SZG4_9EURY|nr:MBL fold metallo-hydrolase [Halovenus carboxidivorans]MXR51064.1 MBL fold metallo-hydrolase [Halovenus carboxidivorans]